VRNENNNAEGNEGEEKRIDTKWENSDRHSRGEKKTKKMPSHPTRAMKKTHIW